MMCTPYINGLRAGKLTIELLNTGLCEYKTVEEAITGTKIKLRDWTEPSRYLEYFKGKLDILEPFKIQQDADKVI